MKQLNLEYDQHLMSIRVDGKCMGHVEIEGGKVYYQQDGIGKSKYTISYHDGKKTHKDGSPFFDIKIFKNKKELQSFIKYLQSQGYKYKYAQGGEIGGDKMAKGGLVVGDSVVVNDSYSEKELSDSRIKFINQYNKNKQL